MGMREKLTLLMLLLECADDTTANIYARLWRDLTKNDHDARFRPVGNVVWATKPTSVTIGFRPYKLMDIVRYLFFSRLLARYYRYCSASPRRSSR